MRFSVALTIDSLEPTATIFQKEAITIAVCSRSFLSFETEIRDQFKIRLMIVALEKVRHGIDVSALFLIADCYVFLRFLLFRGFFPVVACLVVEKQKERIWN